MSCRLARVGFGLAPSLSRALPNRTPTGCAALWLLFFRERETLTRLFGGPQQHLGAAVQTNVFRGGHDHRSLRAGLRGTNGETFKPEDALAVGGQPARGCRAANRARGMHCCIHRSARG